MPYYRCLSPAACPAVCAVNQYEIVIFGDDTLDEYHNVVKFTSGDYYVYDIDEQTLNKG